MEYLLKVSAVVGLFYLCYKLFLQCDTFFEQNRWFLLLGLLTAFLLPLFVIPNYIEYVPLKIPHEGFDKLPLAVATEEPLNISEYFQYLYGFGVLCFLIRFFIQLRSLTVVIFKSESFKDKRFTLVKTHKNIEPFSFFKWIVYNPNHFTPTDLKHIIAHEKAHANHYHSIDILVTQLVSIILWCNPFIWFYNKDLKQNLEYLADKTAQNKLTCKKSYQTLLLKTSMPNHQMVLSNNFYNSLIKKRIVMLNKSKSKKIYQIKYVLVIPLLVLFLMSFNTKDIYIEKKVAKFKPYLVDDNSSQNKVDLSLKETKAQIVVNDNKTASKPNHVKAKARIKKSNVHAVSEINQEKTKIIIDKNTTDDNLNVIKESLKKKGFEVKFKTVKRNPEAEITSLKIDVASKNLNSKYYFKSDEAIAPMMIVILGNHLSIDHQTTREDNEFIQSRNTEAPEETHLQDTSRVSVEIKKETESTHESNPIARLKIAKIDTNNVAISTNNGKYLIYNTHGKIITDEELKEGLPEQIKSISVLKGAIAEAQYGTDEKHRILIIEKKKGDKINIDLDHNTEDYDKEVFLIKENHTNNFVLKGSEIHKKEHPLIIIDGQETEDNIEDLDSDTIKSISILKNNAALNKYGEKGKNGVIEIKTKKK